MFYTHGTFLLINPYDVVQYVVGKYTSKNNERAGAEMNAINIPEGVRGVMTALNERGHDAYVVGGCVRDALLGRTPSDWDVCTSALPDETAEIFTREGRHVIPTGLKHGTVTVIADAMPVEITTFRVDGGYADGRRPTSVAFTASLEEDLRRRDFTINALAADLNERIIDPYGGESDIKRGLIRCVGDANARFGEDYLRILRALRFAAVLGFEIDGATSAAIRANAASVAGISAERVRVELTKLLAGANAAELLRDYADVFAVVIPELAPMFGFEQNSPWHCYDVWEHTLHSVDAAPQDALLRMTMLLHDIGKPQRYTQDEQGVGHFYAHGEVSAELADAILRRLRYDNATRVTIVQLVRHHDRPVRANARSLRRTLNLLGAEQTERLIAVKRADSAGQDLEKTGERLHELDAAQELLRTIIEQQQCFSVRDLAVSGRDILALGVTAGPQIGAMVNALLAAVIDGTVENNADTLLALAREMLAKNGET